MRQAILALSLATLPFLAEATSAHQCNQPALEQDKKLLTFHFGEADDRIHIEEKVKRLPSLKNPAGKGKFDVLEVWGVIYKGRYRMRFTYAVLDKECVLMGQEILEFANVWSR